MNTVWREGKVKKKEGRNEGKEFNEIRYLDPRKREMILKRGKVIDKVRKD